MVTPSPRRFDDAVGVVRAQLTDVTTFDVATAEAVSAFAAKDFVTGCSHVGLMVAASLTAADPDTVLAMCDAAPRDDDRFVAQLAAELRLPRATSAPVRRSGPSSPRPLFGEAFHGGWRVGDVTVPAAGVDCFSDIVNAMVRRVRVDGDIAGAADAARRGLVASRSLLARTVAADVGAALEAAVACLEDRTPFAVIHTSRSYGAALEAIYVRFNPTVFLTDLTPVVPYRSVGVSVLPKAVVTGVVGAPLGAVAASDSAEVFDTARVFFDDSLEAFPPLSPQDCLASARAVHTLGAPAHT